MLTISASIRVPGLTGFGVIDRRRSTYRDYVASGCRHEQPKAHSPSDWCIIYRGRSVEHRRPNIEPDELAIESVFVHKNAASALKLGHARVCGALCDQLHALRLQSTSMHPREIKQAVVGHR